MAKSRTIRPELWDDEQFASLPILSRLFFIGCFNQADDLGVISGNATYLKSRIFPYDESMRLGEINNCITILVNARMLVPLTHDNKSYYVIRCFNEHQSIDKRYASSIISKDFAEANELVDKALSNTHCCTHDESTGGSHGEHMGTRCALAGDSPSTRRGLAEHSPGTLGEEEEKEKNQKNKEEELPKEKEKLSKESTKKEKGVQERMEEFREDVFSYHEYDTMMLQQFFTYWSELNRSGTKMKCEREPTWELSKRLSYWYNRQKTKQNISNYETKHQTSERRKRELMEEFYRADEEFSRLSGGYPQAIPEAI